MGIINHDKMPLKSGLDLPGCYLSFVPGPQSMISTAITMTCNTDMQGDRTYFANATLFIYADKDKKSAGNEPLETKQVSIPVDPGVVYAVLYDSLTKAYPNSSKDQSSDNGDTSPDTKDSAAQGPNDADNNTAPQSSTTNEQQDSGNTDTSPTSDEQVPSSGPDDSTAPDSSAN